MILVWRSVNLRGEQLALWSLGFVIRVTVSGVHRCPPRSRGRGPAARFRGSGSSIAIIQTQSTRDLSSRYDFLSHTHQNVVCAPLLRCETYPGEGRSGRCTGHWLRYSLSDPQYMARGTKGSEDVRPRRWMRRGRIERSYYPAKLNRLIRKEYDDLVGPRQDIPWGRHLRNHRFHPRRRPTPLGSAPF